MAHASLEELHEAIEELHADGRSKVESRASALDMRRAIDQTAATISSLRARAVAEPEAVAEELVDLLREDGTLLGAASDRAPRCAAVFPIEGASCRRQGEKSKLLQHFYLPSAPPTLPPLKSTAAPVGNIGVQCPQVDVRAVSLGQDSNAR